MGQPEVWGGSSGLLTSLTPRCHFPRVLRAGPATAALPADAPGPRHPATSLQRACGGRGEGESWEHGKDAGWGEDWVNRVGATDAGVVLHRGGWDVCDGIMGRV